MKYNEVIERLDYELRNAEAWPDASTKVDEQINLLYIAALSIFKELPLLRQTIGFTESAALTGSVFGANSQITSYALPADIFNLREDGGIASFILDSVIYDFSQGISVDSILSIGDEPFHSESTFFAADIGDNKLYAVGPTTVKISYVPEFTRPTNDDDVNTDFEALDWPLIDNNDTQRAIHLVAAHVSGTTTRDAANAQFQALLEEVYS